jgi:sugar phosphate isomerase/epimerase
MNNQGCDSATNLPSNVIRVSICIAHELHEEELRMGNANTADPKCWELGMSSSMLRPVNEETIGDCVSAGVAHLEVILPRKEDDPYGEVEHVFSWARNQNMHIQSVHLPFGWQWDVGQSDKDARSRAIRGVEDLIAKSALWHPVTVIIHPSYEPIPDEERKEWLKRCQQSLAHLSQFASGYGITLAIECLPRTCLGNTSDEVLFLLEGSPSLGVCCDVNHLLQETPQAFIQRVGNRIKATHISDYDGLDEKHWPPGQGVIDWVEVVRALAENGFQGPLMFEVGASAGFGAIELTEWWRKLLSSLD